MVVTTCDDNNKTDSSLQTLSPAVQESIKNIIKKENYAKYDVIIRGFDTRGNNYLGKLYEIDIIGETAECKKETNIFVKESVHLKNFEFIKVVDSYAKEVFIYTDLSKVFTYLQDLANVPQEDRYKIAKAYNETSTNAIILENLSKRGFRTYNKMEPVSKKYLELGVQQLAKFHALTFVVEHKMPEYYNNKIKVLKSPFCFDKDWEGLMRNVCRHVANLYEDNEVKQKIQNFLPILLEKTPKYCNDQSTVRCTLTHGDFKKNNILVRFENGEPMEIVPVDYQFMNYGCPIKDFFFFIFTLTDRELRKKHLNELKELYFETLSRFLKYFDLEVEAVYPRQEFEKVYTEWMDYGLMITLFVSLVTFTPDNGIDLANLNLSEVPYCPDKIYDDVFRGLIDDFIEWGYL